MATVCFVRLRASGVAEEGSGGSATAAGGRRIRESRRRLPKYPGSGERVSASRMERPRTGTVLRQPLSGGRNGLSPRARGFGTYGRGGARDRIVTAANLGTLLRAEGRYPEAESLLLDCLRQAETIAGKESLVCRL